ncbi:MAG: hypothetical protein QXQ81_05900 [Candidatus Thorarchaeota archaeon]
MVYSLVGWILLVAGGHSILISTGWLSDMSSSHLTLVPGMVREYPFLISTIVCASGSGSPADSVAVERPTTVRAFRPDMTWGHPQWRATMVLRYDIQSVLDTGRGRT